jgi:hypothetical protein
MFIGYLLGNVCMYVIIAKLSGKNNTHRQRRGKMKYSVDKIKNT